MLQGMDQDIVFFTRRHEDGPIQLCQLSGDPESSDQLEFLPIEKGTSLYKFLLEPPAEHEWDENGKKTQRSIIREQRMVEPRVIKAKDAGTIVAFTELDS